MARKDLDEKLAEARRIIEQSDEVTPELGGASFWLLGEVDRLRKIEDGIDKIIVMRKQAAESHYEASKLQHARGRLNTFEWHQMQADTLMGEVWPLEALLNGE